jgi:hypothetical protein
MPILANLKAWQESGPVCEHVDMTKQLEDVTERLNEARRAAGGGEEEFGLQVNVGGNLLLSGTPRHSEKDRFTVYWSAAVKATSPNNNTICLCIRFVECFLQIGIEAGGPIHNLVANLHKKLAPHARSCLNQFGRD